MDSPARSRLRRNFGSIDVDVKFQMVNSAMGGAIPNSPIYLKILPQDDGTGFISNANRLDINLAVRIRDNQEVELLE